MISTACLECSAELQLKDNVLVGEVTSCPECGVELEVVAREPLRLELAPEIEEDWGE